ncbi:endonuclease/exonuclease/phosphatase family protein [Trifolium medium]|uniref:Endonuclease/exonuclease/phosphatase family protein n=1 Tax=Trifolium medium TaxID=97028 RepID=A0A392NK24_9FABA|nr:endonuclease/exonuclease/phosphatase family protein [Trifolium medium]
MLINKASDWGPKPFKMLRCWKEIEGYHAFVRNKLKEIQVEGWGGYILKEKLKRIKKDLMEWHKFHSSNLGERIQNTKEKLNSLDMKFQEIVPNENDIEERLEVIASLHKMSELESSIMWQKARLKWMKEGDANVIHCIDKERVLLEEVKDIKEEIFSHFQNQYRWRIQTGPRMDNQVFKQVSEEEGELLIKNFSEEEIKKVVWDCDSEKSPGPDGISLGFIKIFGKS